MEEEISDIEMFSESSDELVDVLNVMNNEIQQLEEQIEYYKTKAHERFMNNMKLHIQNSK